MFVLQIPDDLQDAIQPEGVTGWDVALAIALVVVAVPISRGVERLARKATRRVPGLSADMVHIAGRGARYLVMFVVGSLALSLIGVEVGWAVAVAAVGLVIVVLIMRPMVENAAAGLLLQSRPSFALGDEVKIAGHTGTVLEISARTTVLKTRAGQRIHIPNTDVLGDTIVVYTAFDRRRATVDIGVDPSADLDAVTRVLVEAVTGVDNVLADPAPEVMARSFGNGFINLTVRFWHGPDTHSDTRVTDGAVRAIQDAVNKAGIDMPPPQLLVMTPPTPPVSGESAENEDTEP